MFALVSLGSSRYHGGATGGAAMVSYCVKALSVRSGLCMLLSGVYLFITTLVKSTHNAFLSTQDDLCDYMIGLVEDDETALITGEVWLLLLFL